MRSALLFLQALALAALFYVGNAMGSQGAGVNGCLLGAFCILLVSAAFTWLDILEHQ